jgi:hypothetical protein
MPSLDNFNKILYGPQYTSFSSGIAENLSCMHDMPLELKGHEDDIAMLLDVSIATLISEKFQAEKNESIDSLISRYPNYGNRDTYWPEMGGECTFKLEILEILDLFNGLLQRQMSVSMESGAKLLAILSVILCKMNDSKACEEEPICALRKVFDEELFHFPEKDLHLGRPNGMAYFPITFRIYLAGNIPRFEPGTHDFSDIGCY